jgi:hypothetical protein
MGRAIRMEGRQFGRLTVIAEAGRDQRKVTWLCSCDCGATVVVRGTVLRNGHTRSCGCLKRELTSRRFTGNKTRRHHVVHGHTTGRRASREYKSWAAMKQRCQNSNHEHYPYYGGRGITVCQRWLGSFENFLEDMGPRPEGRTLDRVDPNGHYEPDNCRWATPQEQRANRRPEGTW